MKTKLFLMSLVIGLSLNAQNIISSSSANCGILTDTRDGQQYQTITIGTQCWMKQNLNYGTPVSDVTQQTNNSIAEKSCYNSTTANCNTYGGIYTWDEAMNYGTNLTGICPLGWHIPTKAEWDTLMSYLGNTTAGTQMKTTTSDSVVWDGTNTSAFSAMPGGIGQSTNFLYQGIRETYWSSTQFSSTDAYDYGLTSGIATLDSANNTKNSGYCIRCIADNMTTGIKENSREGFNIFPSPSTGIFSIAINKTESFKTVKIYNVTGQKVFENKIEGQKKYQINLCEQANGIYFIILEGEKNTVSNKIIIQRD